VCKETLQLGQRMLVLEDTAGEQVKQERKEGEEQ